MNFKCVMIAITGASLVAVNQTNEFFGENTARYRNVKTVSIEGHLVDAKSNFANPIFRTTDSVSGVVSGRVNPLVKGLSSTNAIEEQIYINGINWGMGRVISFDFPNSPNALETDNFAGKFNGTFEFYGAGDSASVNRAFDNLTIPSPALLDNFSESFDATLDENNNYSFNHNVDVKYLSGNGVDPFNLAKTLAENVFNQTLTTYNALIPGYYGDYNSAGKRNYQEFYNAVNGECNFSQKLNLYSSGTSLGTYSVNTTHSFDFDENGKISVTENGEIVGRANNRNSMVANAKAGLNTELSSSYSRCSDVYNAYKSLLVDGTYSETLNTTRMQVTKGVDYNRGSATYSVNYTDEQGFVSSTKKQVHDISLEKDKNIIKVKEQGQIVTLDKKGKLSLSEYINLLPTRTSAKNRCNKIYSQNGYGGSLKNESQDFSINGIKGEDLSSLKMGKALTYNYSFTDDAEVYDNGIFAKLQIKTNDQMPVLASQQISVPNLPHKIQTPNQTTLATRTVSAVGVIRRNSSIDTFNNLTQFQTTVLSARNYLLTQVITEGLSIFSDNPKLSPLDQSEIYVKDLKYDFNNARQMNMSATVNFPAQRFSTTKDTRLIIGT